MPVLQVSSIFPNHLLVVNHSLAPRPLIVFAQAIVRGESKVADLANI